MTDQYEDNSDEQESSLLKEIRDLYNAEKSAKKALEAELATLRGQVRNANVSSVLSAKGLDVGIAQFIPQDVNDAEAVEAWLAENGKFFGVPAPTPTDTNLSPEAPNRLQQLSSSGSSPNLQEEILSKLKVVGKDSTSEETQELLRQAAALYNR